MIVREQRPIKFINDCGALVDYAELSNAILWYQDEPTASTKHIYLHGKYPAVSIRSEKVHIHRLLMMYWLGTKIPHGYSVHHLNENKFDARKENLSVLPTVYHNGMHNSGKIPSKAARNALRRYNHSKKGTRQPFHRPDVSYAMVVDLQKRGLSVNKIAETLGCDWMTVKARIDDMRTTRS